MEKPKPCVQTTRWVMPTRLDAVSRVSETLQRLLETTVDEIKATQLTLGLVEALTNVVKHGHRQLPEGVMELTVTQDSGTWCFTIVDAGHPIPAAALAGADGSVFDFDPQDVQSVPEGGMGLSLIHMLFDKVDYRSAAERNELTLTVQLPT